LQFFQKSHPVHVAQARTKEDTIFMNMQHRNPSNPQRSAYLIETKYTITVDVREPVAGVLEKEINSSEQRTEVISRELTVV
jgi:hypothetical protein